MVYTAARWHAAKYLSSLLALCAAALLLTYLSDTTPYHLVTAAETLDTIDKGNGVEELGMENMIDDDEAFDEEEFEARGNVENEEKKASTSSFQFPFKFKREHLEANYPLDAAAVVILLLVIIHALTGRRQNKQIVKAWEKTSKQIFEENFTLFQFPGEYAKERSWNSYELYASGRRNCAFMNAHLELKPRQCLWRHAFAKYATQTDDIITMNFQLDALDSIVFAIVKRREQNNLLYSYNEVKLHCKQFKPDFSNNMNLFAETSDVKDLLLCSSSLRGLLKHSDLIKWICVTDLHTEEGSEEPKPVLSVSLKVPDLQATNQMQVVLRFLMMFLDHVSTLSLSDKLRTTIKSRRAENEKHDLENSDYNYEKEEAKRAQKKKAEEERLSKMTAEQKRKYEEKRTKKQSKPKFKML